MKGKRLLILFWVSLLIFCPLVEGNEPPISVLVNGKAVESDVAPQLVQGRTMLPFRAILTALGVSEEEIKWWENSRSVEVRTHTVFLFLTIGSYQSVKNTQIVLLEAPPYLFQGRTMVPVRFISESLGASVNWQEEERIVTIEKKSSIKKTAI